MSVLFAACAADIGKVDILGVGELQKAPYPASSVISIFVFVFCICICICVCILQNLGGGELQRTLSSVFCDIDKRKACDSPQDAACAASDKSRVTKYLRDVLTHSLLPSLLYLI